MMHFLTLALVGVLTWLAMRSLGALGQGGKDQGRHDQGRQGRSGQGRSGQGRSGHGQHSHGQGSHGSTARQSAQARPVEDMRECPVCQTFRPQSMTSGCGRGDCPFGPAPGAGRPH